jgi:hypothetical protein
MDGTIVVANSEDEDCGDVLMVRKGMDSIENLWVLDSAFCFHMCSNRYWFDTNKACDESYVTLANNVGC